MAVKPSISADRVARLLTFLGGHEETAFTLSELARNVSIDKATCQAMLLSLVEHGYVSRDESRKRYSLGPTVTALANGDGLHQRIVRFARREMERLTAELDLESTASVISADRILMVARVLRAPPFGLSLRVGQSQPFVPPLGVVHVAWSSPDDIERWLDRGQLQSDAPERRHHDKALSAVRKRGFSVTLDDPACGDLQAAMDRIGTTPADLDARAARDRALRALATKELQIIDIRAQTRYRSNNISAPVFDRDGRVVLALGLLPEREMRGRELEEFVRRLTQTTSLVTDAIGGRAASR